MNNLEFDFKRLKKKDKKAKLNIIKLSNKHVDTDYYIDNLNINNLFSNHIDNLNNKKSNYYTIEKNKIIERFFKDIIKSKNKNIVINEKNSNYFIINELDFLLTAYYIDSIKERYEYIYDYVCDQLDNEFIFNNICDFKSNKCISRRDLECKGCTNPLIYGCCYTKGNVCKNLVNSHCTIKCIACKLFTCRYLSRKDIKYRVNDILGLKLFFNFRQKSIIYNNLFTDRDDFIKLLLQKK